MFCLFDIKLTLGQTCTTVKNNCALVRAFILDYVTKRKEGKVKSQVNNVDMLTLFLESPEIFTDDFIVDELMDFFFAGTLTTQYSTQTMLTHFVHEPESLKRTRDEFKKVVKEQFPGEQQPSSE